MASPATPLTPLAGGVSALRYLKIRKISLSIITRLQVSRMNIECNKKGPTILALVRYSNFSPENIWSGTHILQVTLVHGIRLDQVPGFQDSLDGPESKALFEES